MLVALGLVILGSALGGYLLFHSWSRTTPSASRVGDTATAMIRPAAKKPDEWVTESELLQSWKSTASKAPVFFDTSIVETGRRQSAHWMMEASESEQASEVVASGERDLWFMRMTQTGKRLTFTGEWAEYQDETGGRFRSGTLAGVGEWTVPDSSLVASLQFHSNQDNSVWKYSVSATATAPGYTDVQFLHRVEEMPLIQPLLYMELMPRRLEWASHIESLLPCMPESRVEVPLLTAGEAEIQVDGQLAEPMWSRKYYGEHGRIGEIKGRPAKRGARLLLRATPTAVLLGVRVPEIPYGQRFSLSLALCPGFSIPISQSPTFKLDLSPDGSVDGSLYRGQQEAPWKCDWQTGTATADSYWNVEILIPIKGLGISPWPDTGRTWRLNVVVTSPGEGQIDKTVAQWGYPDIGAVEHGMVVHFATIAKGGQDS